MTSARLSAVQWRSHTLAYTITPHTISRCYGCWSAKQRLHCWRCFLWCSLWALMVLINVTLSHYSIGFIRSGDRNDPSNWLYSQRHICS